MARAPEAIEAGASAEFDAIVVGAGFAGMYVLHRLRSMGLSVRAYEAASGIGGTWFFNRYPGARCDVESIDYSYSFDETLEQEWNWTERYAQQPEILAYLNHVADRFDLRRDIQLNTSVLAAHHDDLHGLWTVSLDDGTAVTARFCIMASGVLSQVKTPDIPGWDSFAGPILRTSRWPHEPVDLRGQRVAIIGTGSTGVQAIPLLAREAAHLYVFQRTPNYSIPARNRPLAPDYVAQIKANYRQRREEGRRSVAGVPGDPPPRSAVQTDPRERLKIYEKGWEIGGGPAILRSFNDLLTDADANATVAEFVRGKIREIVDDPEIAETLSPRDHPLGAKRICVDTDYFATFNRDDVTLIDVRRTPIEEIVPAGIRTSERQIDVDVLILAMGFDAVTGAVLNIDVRGRDGLRLRDVWAEGPRTYLGLAVAGFPNMFLVAGPGSPSVLGNVVHHIEQHVEWIADAIDHVERHELTTIEAAPAAQDAWGAHVNEVAAGTLYPTANTWFTGANIPGKPRVFMAYAGGANRYRAVCEDVARRGYDGFVLSGDAHADPGAVLNEGVG